MGLIHLPKTETAEENTDRAARAARLREARKKAGYRRASRAAEEFGWAYPTYAAHENGRRGYDARDATIYAACFGCDAEYLLSGKVNQKQQNSSALSQIFHAINYVPLVDISDLSTFETFMAGIPPSSALPREPLPSQIKAGPRAFVVLAGDDAVAPAVPRNALSYLDPDRNPETGKIVAALVEGYPTLVLRKFRLIAGLAGKPEFELIAINPDYPSFSSITHAIRILGGQIGVWLAE